MKTVIVVGATGLIGKNLVSLLAEQDNVGRVVSLTRRAVIYTQSKVVNHVVDFSRLSDFTVLFEGDVLCSCLGTTAKQAGSVTAQRIVDLDYQLHAARLAREHGVTHYVLVSSSGANAKSLSPYLRMKGELEDAIVELAFKQTCILQPSLLLGDRSETRMAEQLASRLLPALCRLPGLSRYRPIYARDVALKIIEVLRLPQQGVKRLTLEQVFPDKSSAVGGRESL